MDRKELVKLLDDAASNSRFGASSKQCWFLAGLMAEVGDEPEDIGLDILDLRTWTLSSKSASEWISHYLASKAQAA